MYIHVCTLYNFKNISIYTNVRVHTCTRTLIYTKYDSQVYTCIVMWTADQIRDMTAAK